MNISKLDKTAFPEVLDVWESAVRASHDFLSEDDIQFLKPIVLNDALPNLDLSGIRGECKEILGFVAVSEQAVAMLFISPNFFGKGMGKALMKYAEVTFGVNKVDVNEQNTKALGFYQSLGYVVLNRSALDAQGKPFPILHMVLTTAKQ